MHGRTRLHRSGQVMVILLLAMSLLSSLVFYVVNIGDQVNRRVVVQNAADSAAISGATWMARSMNLVAMNNVAQSRMYALIPHLDSFPLSTRMAHEETASWVDALDRQLKRGVADTHLREGLESLHERMKKQRDILAPIDGFFRNEYDVTTATHWSIRGAGGLPPHGHLWQAADSLDLLSQSVQESAPVLAQRNAARWGELNYAETAFTVPLLPDFPAVRTDFDDFEEPVKKGRIPDRAYPHRLGPYDRLFRWRDYQYKNIYERDRMVSGKPGHGPIRGGRGNVNVGGRRRGRSARGRTTNPNDHWTYRVTGRILMGYRVYGPFEWMRRRIHGYAQGWWQDRGYYPGELSDTFFHKYQKDISSIKLGYIWGDRTLKTVHYPQWRVDYPECKQIAADDRNRISQTMYYLVEIRSRYPKDSPNYLSEGSYVTNGELPIAMWINGWEDAADWGIPQTDEWVWEDRYEYETTEDWEIGIHKAYDGDGNVIWHPVYMIAQYVFGGIDVGGEVQVTNPANYADRGDLPAPILMDTAPGDYDISQPHHDLGVRRDIYTYLGVASRNDRPAVWSERFGSGNPYGNTVATAQVEIFNTSSWDFWTQDWKVKLVPVTQWRHWLDRMEDTADDAALTDGVVEPDDVMSIHEYLSRFNEEMVNEMIRH